MVREAGCKGTADVYMAVARSDSLRSAWLAIGHAVRLYDFTLWFACACGNAPNPQLQHASTRGFIVHAAPRPRQITRHRSAGCTRCPCRACARRCSRGCSCRPKNAPSCTLSSRGRRRSIPRESWCWRPSARPHRAGCPGASCTHRSRGTGPADKRQRGLSASSQRDGIESRVSREWSGMGARGRWSGRWGTWTLLRWSGGQTPTTP